MIKYLDLLVFVVVVRFDLNCSYIQRNKKFFFFFLFLSKKLKLNSSEFRNTTMQKRLGFNFINVRLFCFLLSHF